MLGVNYVVLGGRLTRDPFIQHLENKKGEPLTSVQFKLAVSEDRKDEAGNYVTNFISCKAIGYPASFIEKYCKQGTSVIIQGKIRSEDYTNKEGERVFGQPVQVEKITFAESSGASGGRETAPTVPSQAQQAAAPVQQDPGVMPREAVPAQQAQPTVQQHIPAEQVNPAPQAPPFGTVPTFDGGYGSGFNGNV